MTRHVKVRRAYDSPRRREQARATRSAILEAARALFVETGYVATTMQAIAERAATSPATLYATFGSKRSILSALVDVSIAGDDEAVPIADRAWVGELRAEPDPRRRIRMLAHQGRLILERRTPIDGVLQAAAATDPEIAALWQQVREQRHTGQGALLRMAVGPGNLRPGLSWSAAVDIGYAIGSPETYRSLVDDRGWSPERFERWYAESLERLLGVRDGSRP